MSSRVLVVDDEPAIRDGLREILADAGHEAAGAADGASALESIEDHDFHVVIADIHMPGMDGLELLRRIRANYPHIEVILLTAHATYRMAVDAVKAGAYDFLTKPFDIDLVRLTVARALEHRQLLTQNELLEKEVQRLQGPTAIVGESPAFKRVLQIAERVAPTSSTVLITGETGTGKEVIARTIHERSRRRDKPFLTVNCGALNENLLESELFGYARGAFTGADRHSPGLFETANGGTFFLDEIGNITPAMQARLLRVLQEGEILRVGERTPRRVDVRVLAATNADLRTAVRAGEFREDLFYRLNVVWIELPPLRERPEDIPLLAQAFLERLSQKLNRRMRGFSPSALRRLQAHRWPGNVRELENTIERAIIMAPTPLIEEFDLPFDIGDTPPETEGPPLSLADLEREHILRVLKMTRGHQGNAATILGINRRTLYRKLQEYGWRSKELVENEEAQDPPPSEPP
ncbi:MAG: sigma-54 dependent transcriptional regulator [Planctomycetota bacterium]